MNYSDYVTPGFISWTCYHAIRPGEIQKRMPLVVRGQVPPEIFQRDGIPCTRIDYDPVRRFVIYATPCSDGRYSNGCGLGAGDA